MSVIQLDLSVDQGSRFEIERLLQNCGVSIDLTGYTFKAQIRKNFNSADPALGEFTITPKNQTTDKGWFKLILPADVSSALVMGKPAKDQEFTPTKFVWDLQWVPPGGDPDEDVETIIRGILTVTPEVTK